MPIPNLDRQRNILLTTYRRDSSPVGTPVNVAVKDGHTYIRSWASSGKAKRIGRNPAVTVAPCTGRGTQTGRTVGATTRLLEAEEAGAAARAIEAKYPVLQGMLVPLVHRIRRLRTVHYELVFDDD